MKNFFALAVAAVLCLSNRPVRAWAAQMSFDGGASSIRGIVESLRANAAVAPSLAAAASAAVPSSWKEYSYPDTGFAISAPFAPIYKEIKENGGITHFYLAEQRGQIRGAVSISTGPETAEESIRLVRTFYERTEEEVSFKNISIDGHPGLRIAYEDIQGTGWIHRFYAVGNRLYQIYARSENDGTFHKETHHFFNSFRLLKP